MKNRRRTTTKTKRPSAPKVSGRRKPSSTNANTKIALLEHERDELLEQQKATAEVLRVISTSPGDLQPVFQVMLENATRICEAKFGNLGLLDGSTLRIVALHNAPSVLADVRHREPVVDLKGSIAGVAISTKRPVHVADLAADERYARSVLAMAGGARTALVVPMLKEDEIIGTIAIYRHEVRPFADNQIELLTNFAAQAVIAIENTRLLNELRETLQQQTGTADVLRVISSSPGELEPVFQTMLENATRICEAKFGTLNLHTGDTSTVVAMHNVPESYGDFRRGEPTFRYSKQHPLGRVAATKKVLQIADLREDAGYAETDPSSYRAMADLAGARTILVVPMLKESDLVGTVSIYRQEVRPFTDKQIALVQNFAAQAVIAIENTRLLNELRQRTDDLTGSLDRQTAISEVLGVISSSPSDLQPVFQAIVESTARLCEADNASIFQVEGDGVRLVANYGQVSIFRLGEPRPISSGSLSGRVLISREIIHVVDALAVADGMFPDSKSGIERQGIRTVLGVPLMRGKVALGAIVLRRMTVRPFTDKQIELVKNFAAQAVIAIENTRLLNELRQRTDDLTESLEQQTATSEVLGVISSSPGELDPVFDAMLQNAVRICDAKFGNLWVREGDKFRIVAIHGAPQEYHDYLFSEPLVLPDPQSAMGRVAATGQVLQIDDISTAPTYGMRMRIATIEIAKARTLLAVPMLKDKKVVGIIGIYRQDVRAFADKQIALVQNFAAQAVIAIENTRLLNELRESLQQQTATADVLKVISSSPGDLEPVFEAMLENATRICEAKFGTMYFREADGFRAVAMHGAPPAYVESRLHKLLHPGPATGIGRVLQTKQAVQIEDASADQGYSERDPMRVSAVELGGVRTILDVPMLKENEVIGAVAIYREVVRPFTDKQVALVQNFANQAVIAIENTRLLNELRQSLEQQTATADVLKVISSSPGELEPVFQAMLESATRICEAKIGNLLLFDGMDMRVVAMHNAPREHEEMRRRNPVIPLERSIAGPLVRTKRLVFVADITAEEPYASSPLAKVGGARTAMAVPMLREDELVGAITIYREEVRPFTDKQIALVQNFAAQAVIAIENTRLLNELRQRTTDLSESLEQQTATSEVLGVISSSPGELEPVFRAMLANATRICRAKSGFLFRAENDDFRVVASLDALSDNAEQLKDRVFKFGPSTPIGRAKLTRQIVHVPSLAEDQAYLEREPLAVWAVEQAHVRTVLVVPMLSSGA